MSKQSLIKTDVKVAIRQRIDAYLSTNQKTESAGTLEQIISNTVLSREVRSLFQISGADISSLNVFFVPICFYTSDFDNTTYSTYIAEVSNAVLIITCYSEPHYGKQQLQNSSALGALKRYGASNYGFVCTEQATIIKIQEFVEPNVTNINKQFKDFLVFYDKMQSILEGIHMDEVIFLETEDKEEDYVKHLNTSKAMLAELATKIGEDHITSFAFGKIEKAIKKAIKLQEKYKLGLKSVRGFCHGNIKYNQCVLNPGNRPCPFFVFGYEHVKIDNCIRELCELPTRFLLNEDNLQLMMAHINEKDREARNSPDSDDEIYLAHVLPYIIREAIVHMGSIVERLMQLPLVPHKKLFQKTESISQVLHVLGTSMFSNHASSGKITDPIKHHTENLLINKFISLADVLDCICMYVKFIATIARSEQESLEKSKENLKLAEIDMGDINKEISNFIKSHSLEDSEE